MRLDQPAAARQFLAGDRTALLVSQIDTGPRRQPLDRLSEAQAVDLAHERDDVAAFCAGEAVPQPASGRDVERRSLFLVERAESLKRAAASAAQLQVLPDNLGDRRAGADGLDVLVADPAWHLASVAPGKATKGQLSRGTTEVPRLV